MTDRSQQIEESIANALKAGDVTAAYDLLKLLAVENPARAELVLATMELGIKLNRAATSQPTPYQAVEE